MYQIYFDYGLGAGWEDKTSSLYIPMDSLPIIKLETLHTSLKTTSNSVKFSLDDNATIQQILTLNDNVKVKITKDSSPYFVGVMRNNFGVQYNNLRVDATSYEAIDSWYFTKDILLTSDISYFNITLSALIINLLTLLGYVSADYNVPILSTPIVAFSKPIGTALKSVVEELLYEAGYVINVDENGILQFTNLNPSSVTIKAIVSSADMSSHSLERKERDCEAVQVTVNPTIVLTDVKIWEDTKGASGSLPCSISVPTGTYYPSNATASLDSTSKYKIDDYDIIATRNQTLSWSKTGNITLLKSVFGPIEQNLKFTSTGGGVLTKLQTYGDAYCIGDTYIFKKEYVSSTTKIKKIDIKYLQSTLVADALAQYVASWEFYSWNTIGFVTTLTNLTIGDYITFSEPKVSGITGTLRVIKITETGDKDNSLKVVAEAYNTLTYSPTDPVSISNASKAVKDSNLATLANLAGLQPKTTESRFMRSATMPETPLERYPTGWFLDPPTGNDSLWIITGQFYGSSFASIIPDDDTYPSELLIPGNGWSTPIAITEMPTSITTANVSEYVPSYLGASGSAPTNPTVGDWFMYLGTTNTEFTQFLLYVWTATGWMQDTDSGHLSSAWTDYITLASSSSTTVGLFNVITASAAFLQSLFAKNIEIQSGGSIYSGYNADGSGSPTQGFWLGANGLLKAKSGYFSGAVNANQIIVSGLNPGENVVFSSPDERIQGGGVWTNICEIVSGGSGTLRIKYDMHGYSGKYGTANIYKNGSPYGTQRSVYGATYTTFSQDLAFDDNDLIQIWVISDGAQPTYVRNISVSIDQIPGMLTHIFRLS